MWFWVSAAVLICLGLFWRQSHARFERHWNRLIKVLDALGAGREPGSYVFLNGGRFEELSEGLQKVAREQDRQRKLAEDERFNLRTILSSMEEGVMVVDSRHVIQRVNLSFLTLFHLRATPIGQTVLRSLRQPEFDEMVAAALRTADPQAREVSIPGARPVRHVAVHAVPLRDSSGQLGVLAIFRDVTRLKQLEEVRREFVANVSHELRTPLSIFHGYVEMLLETPGLPEQEVTKIFEVLKRHSLRLNALVEDLLVLARLESRREEMQFEPIELQSFVHAIAMDWAAKTARKKVAVVLAVPTDLPTLRADPLRLEQIFNNLLDNALKYTPSGGRISIRAVRDDAAVILSVDDTGAGIPPVDLPHVFERFYRADKARSREMGGTGLGLSIVKHIAHAHGGSVHAESSYGSGTSIGVRLPFEPKLSEPVEDELSEQIEAAANQATPLPSSALPVSPVSPEAEPVSGGT